MICATALPEDFGVRSAWAIQVGVRIYMIEQRLSPELASHAWTEALSRALEARGSASLSAYVDSRPESSLVELATDLCGPDTTPIALEQRLIAEAEATGTMERCARGILARELRDELPRGWNSSEGGGGNEMNSQARRLSEVFLSLAIALPETYRDTLDRVQHAMNAAELPAGWLPEGPDDPALVELFACYWTGPSR